MMGATLATKVYVHWKHLPDRPFRLLCHMALTIKDSSPTPTYWGGRDMLAQALGLDAGQESSHQSVKRAMRAIVSAGAAKVAYQGHAGKRTEYELTLDRFPAKGVTESTPEGVTERPLRGSLSDPAGGQLVTPLGTTVGGTEDFREEESISPKVTTEGARSVRKATESRLKLLRSRLDSEASA